MAFWVIDREALGYIYQCPVETPTTNVLDSRVDNMRRRLKVLSKGLLEAQDKHFEPVSTGDYLYGFRVNFLHRTVKDYLQTPEAQLILKSWSGVRLNPDLEICSALGALAKMTPSADFVQSGDIREFTLLFFHHAQMAEFLSFEQI